MKNIISKLIVLVALGAVSSCSIGCSGLSRPAAPADPNQATIAALQQIGFLGIVESMTRKDKPSPVYHEKSNTQKNGSYEFFTNQIKDLREEVRELKREREAMQKCDSLIDQQVELW